MRDLKRNLSALVGAAEQGERIVVTRHGRAVAVLGPAEAAQVHVGDRFGKAHLVPFLRAPTRGGYLRMLEEDRQETVGVRPRRSIDPARGKRRTRAS